MRWTLSVRDALIDEGSRGASRTTALIFPRCSSDHYSGISCHLSTALITFVRNPPCTGTRTRTHSPRFPLSRHFHAAEVRLVSGRGSKTRSFPRGSIRRIMAVILVQDESSSDLSSHSFILQFFSALFSTPWRDRNTQQKEQRVTGRYQIGTEEDWRRNPGDFRSDQIRSNQIKSRTSSCCWFRKTEAAGNQRKPQFLLNIWQKSSTLVYSITLSLIYKRDLNTRKSSQTFIKCFHHYVKFTPFCYEITTRCSLQLNNEILIHQHLTKNNRRVPVMLWRYLQKKSKHFPIKFF